MAKNIEQEIDRTLACLGEGTDVQLSPMFVERLSSRAAQVRPARRVGYGSRSFYPVVVAVLVVLNAAVGMARWAGRERGDVTGQDQISVMASEYGIGEQGYGSL